MKQKIIATDYKDQIYINEHSKMNKHPSKENK